MLKDKKSGNSSAMQSQTLAKSDLKSISGLTLKICKITGKNLFSLTPHTLKSHPKSTNRSLYIKVYKLCFKKLTCCRNFQCGRHLLQGLSEVWFLLRWHFPIISEHKLNYELWTGLSVAILRNEYFSDWKSSQCFNTKTVTVLFPGGSRVLEAPAFVSAQVFKAFKENPLRGSCASLDKNSHSMKVIWEKLCILDKHEHLAFEELKKLTLCHTTKPIPYSKTTERVTKTG